MIRKNSNTLYETLKADILAGHFAPGSKLKIETLKERYGMGVNVIRESLARLATEDLVDFEDQKGFRAAETSSCRLNDLTRMRILLENDGAIHSMSQGGIDWESTLIAAHHKLSYIEEKMCEEEETNYKTWHECDWRFHEALVSACGSELHQVYHKRIFDQYRQYVMVDLKTNGFRGRKIIEEHQAILDAALNRDNEGITKALERHLSYYHRSHAR
jgi:DNA-binding GntR family transcriptional regulator